MENPTIKALKVGGHIYQLVEPYLFEYSMYGADFRLLIKKGYTFDGASIPSAFWGFPLMLFPAHPRIILGSMIHDLFYDTSGHINKSPFGHLSKACGCGWYEYSDKVSKLDADLLFHAINKKQGMDIFRRNVTYLAVSIFGRRF